MPDDKREAIKDLTELTEDEGGYAPEFGDTPIDPSSCSVCGNLGFLPVMDFDDSGAPQMTDEVACPFCQPPEEPGDL